MGQQSTNRAFIIHPFAKGEKTLRNPQECLNEACSLALAIDLDIVIKETVNIRQLKPATYIGTGKVEEFAGYIEADDIGLVIFNSTLSPVQQRNLENKLKCKVIDRTALILEIFGERAQTKEGVLQVELASLDYQKSRLVRSWTHLERQRGGFGFMGGPGERQIESDRRMINDRITLIKKQLESVKKTRALQRKSRSKVPYPIVALVGYTNAGKSTLFNQLTGEDVYAEDALFATLDPTMRKVSLPSKKKIILSDTVGFISNLPTELIAAFRATLEEVIEADLILHVRDLSSNDFNAQKQDVEEVLRNLGLEKQMDESMIEVINKIDIALDAKDYSKKKNTVIVSALTGKDCDKLLTKIDNFFLSQQEKIKVKIPVSDGKTIAWLHEHAEKVKMKTIDEFVEIEAYISPKNAARFKKLNS